MYKMTHPPAPHPPPTPPKEVGRSRSSHKHLGRSMLVGAAAAATTATVYGVLTNNHLNNRLRDALAIFRRTNIDFQLALEISDIPNVLKCAVRTYIYSMRAASTYNISELNGYQRGSELNSVKKSLDAITKTLDGNLSKENNEMQVAYVNVKNASDAAAWIGVVYDSLVVGGVAGLATQLVAYGVPAYPALGMGFITEGEPGEAGPPCAGAYDC